MDPQNSPKSVWEDHPALDSKLTTDHGAQNSPKSLLEAPLSREATSQILSQTSNLGKTDPGIHLFLLSVVGICLVGMMGCGESPSSAPEGPAESPVAQASPESLPAGVRLPEKPPTTGRGVLEAMAAVYQSAKGYADAGEVRLYVRKDQDKVEDQADFAVTFVRPNKLRMEVYQAKVVCDGQHFRAAIDDLVGQVLEVPAPKELSLQSITNDSILADVLLGGIAGGPPQLLLLVDKNALPQILQRAQEPELIEPGKIGSDECYRVAIRRPEGQEVLWVDKKTYLLRRIEYPTDELAQAISQTGKPDEIALIADFHSATFTPPVDEKTFLFEVPKEAKVVKYFIPPDPRLVPDPAQLLDKAVPNFKFTDLAGQPVTPEQLKGKVVYLDFWGTQCQPCRQSLPQVEKVFAKYKDNSNVAFLAVSVDPPAVENKELEQIFADLKVSIPIVRDLEGHGARQFILRAIPTSFLIGKDGRVQDFQIGYQPTLETDLPAKIEKLLAGENIFQAAQEQFLQRVRQYEEALQRATEGKPPEGANTQQQEIPRSQIHPKTDPTAFRLHPLWKWQEGGGPGNILVVERPEGPPRILVVDRFKKVIELSADGKALATHDLGLQAQEVVTFLITGFGSGQKRVFGAVAVQQQRIHVFDDQFQVLFRFPPDALEHRHAGIYDAVFGDLNGDGQGELYVSYWDVVGVQQVDLTQGVRTWTFRQIANVARLAVGPADPAGKRLLWCAHDRGTLVSLDFEGHRQTELILPNRPLYAAFTADLTGDGQPEWCGMHIPELGRVVMVGFDLTGKELWTYELPQGVPEHPIEPVFSGRLLPGAPGHWIFPGPDGSLHLVGADGKKLDMFYYGEPLCGLAAGTLQGQPILLVATPKSVDAWRVEPLPTP